MPLTTDTTEDCQGIIHIGSGVITVDELVEASHAALVELVRNTQNFHYEFLDLTHAPPAEELEANISSSASADLPE